MLANRGYRFVPHALVAPLGDTRGAFRIQDIPPGVYAVEVWHERLGVREVSVEIEAGRTTRVEVEVPFDGPSPG